MLRIDVFKKLGDFTVDVKFTGEGHVTGLFGSSGAGKTSLVNMIAGLLRPDRGLIAIGDEVLDDTLAGIHVPPHRRRIGYVFQDARLFPHLSVSQNLHYGRRMNGVAYDRAHQDRVVDLLDIGKLLARRTGQLSGGERQRVALGRALLSRDCCCSTSRWDRLTARARRKSCPSSSGCATRRACRWSMSATTPPNFASWRRRWW